MDKATLVGDKIEDGKKLVAALEGAGLPIASAMWLRVSDDANWRLYIASPDVEAHGPLSVYRFMDSVLNKQHLSIEIDDLSAANTSNHFVNTISKALDVTNSVVTISNCTFGNINVDSAVVYKVTRGARASSSPPKVKSAIGAYCTPAMGLKFSNIIKG